MTMKYCIATKVIVALDFTAIDNVFSIVTCITSAHQTRLNVQLDLYIFRS